MNITFNFVRATDPELEDDEYVVSIDGVETKRFGVQVYGRKLYLNEYEYDGKRLVSMTDHGTFRKFDDVAAKIIKLL